MHDRMALGTMAALLGVLLAASTPADAKVDFRGPSRYFPTGLTPTSVAIADLDRDGHADLVVTNARFWSDGASISILRGRGDGTFEPQRQIAAGDAPSAVVVEDFDGDGLLDLAVSNWGSARGPEVPHGTVSVYLGNGDATFRAPADYSAGDFVRSMRAVDLDEDGHLDLVTEGAVLLGHGDGTFSHGLLYGTNFDWFVAVGDLDRDGHPDLVTSNYFAQEYETDPRLRAYAVRLGHGDGTFGAPVRQGNGVRCWDLELADLDQDGMLDLVICNHGDDRGASSGVLFHRGRGDGTFGAASLIPTAFNPYSLAVADLNGDGRLDLVTTNCADDPDFDENSLTILLGNGDGTFQRQPQVHTGAAPTFVATGLLDADALLDLVAVDQGQSAVSVFLGNGDGTFGNPDQVLDRRVLGLAAGDFDRDGRADLASTNGGPYTDPGGLSVIRGKGDGTFGPPLDSRSVGRDFVNPVNLDDDLLLDLVVATPTGVTAMLGNGDGTFRGLAETYLDPRTPALPAIADFDRDGHMDLAVPHQFGADEASIVLGRGDGTFGRISRVATGSIPLSAATGDLNGDGMLDLVLGLRGYSISVMLGHGDGTFAPQVTHATGDYLGEGAPVGLADLDEDGNIDVVNGNLIRLGNGDGTLHSATRFDVRSGERGLVLADLDGDHHVDLVSLYGNEERIVSVYAGRGDGTFEPRVEYGTGAYPRSLVAGDFDGDGRIDLAVSNNGSSSISIYLNRSQAPVIPVNFQLRPAVVNPRSESRWITGVLEVAAPHSPGDIDVASIRLNSVVPVDPAAPSSEGRGSRELVLRFDRAALAAVLPAGERVPVTITGTLGRGSFEGSTTARVLGRGVTGSVIGPPLHGLSLRVLSPVGSEGRGVRLGMTLATEAPARLDVLDVAGRVVASRSLESLEAGAHELELASTGTLAPGIYFIRLRQGTQIAHTRMAVLR